MCSSDLAVGIGVRAGPPRPRSRRSPPLTRRLLRPARRTDVADVTAIAADLRQGTTLLQDILAAYQAKFAGIPADEAVVADAVQIAAMIDPALAPAVMILPIAEALVAWVVANNRSIGPDAGQSFVPGSISGTPSWR